jgi:hypothetical protein
MAVPLPTARRQLFWVWTGALLVYALLLMAAPHLRESMTITSEDANNALLKILSLVIPVVGVFSGFWFGPDQRTRNGQLSNEKWVAALLSTGSYHLILLTSVLLAIFSHYGEGYPSFDQRIGFSFQLGVYLAFLATAPAAFLTGSESIEVGN